MLDAFSDFHVGEAYENATDSNFMAEILNDQWCSIFGPPDVLMSDEGSEYADKVNDLDDIFGVFH